MSISQSLEDIYEDLSRLLYDVCYFLNGELQNGHLSPEGESAAKKLMARSQKQCVTLTTMTTQLEKSRPYMQMAIKTEVIETDNQAEYVETDVVNSEQDGHYEMPENQNAIPSQPIIMVEENICPYENYTIQQLEKEKSSAKYGPLQFKKNYFFSLLEKRNLVHAILIEHWLIIYSGSKKDIKPIQTLDVLGYTATEKKDCKLATFEIHSPGRKTYEFIARTNKDMQQWIVALNCKQTSSIPGEEEIIEEAEDLDEIYTSVPEPSNDQNSRISTMSINSEDTPDLPPRKPNFIQHITSQNDSGYAKYMNSDSVKNDIDEDPENEYDELIEYQKKNTLNNVLQPHYDEEVDYDEPLEEKKNNVIILPQKEEELPEYDTLLEPKDLGKDNKELPEEPEEIYDELADFQISYKAEVHNNNKVEFEEDAEYDELGDYLRVDTQPVEAKNPVTIGTSDTSVTTEVEEIYDELADTSITKNDEPEEVYDELAEPPKSITPEQKIENKPKDTDVTVRSKPAVNPKPNIQKKLSGRISKLKEGNKTTGQEEVPNKMQNLIQQMERTLGSRNKKF